MNNQNFILNSSNYDSARKVFAYKLPIPQSFANKRVGLSYCSIYKQFENVLSTYGNNVITITWANNVNYTITIPDGNYSVSELNDYLQYSLVQQKLYLLDSSGKIVTYVEILSNPTAYGTSLFFYTVPTSAMATTAGLTQPSGAPWTFNNNAKNPKLILTQAFGKLLGFAEGTYGNGTANLAVYSTLTPQMAVVNSLLLRTNLINNEFTNPSDVISAMDLNGSYGDLMVKSVGQILYSNIAANNFYEIVVYFSDQNYNKLSIKDTEVCIHLSMVDK